MKKTLMFLSALLLWSACVAAQTTAITATVVDSDSTVWANAPWSLSFQVGPYQSNPAAYTIGGSPLDPAVTQQSGAANGSGVITFTVYRSTSVSPIGSSWNLNICPNASSRCSSFNFSTSGATLNLNAQINAGIVAPRFQAVSGSYGYNDGEALLQLKPASTYWNVTSSVSRCYTGSAWGACSSGGGTPTALSPNPTRVGQMWGYLHGAAPNQGWSDLMAQWYNPYDYGAAGDGTTNDNVAFTDMVAAAVDSGTPYNIMLMPRTGPFVLTTPIDFSGANMVFASYDPTFTGTILYNGVDAGPAITMAQNTFGSFVAVRGTSTAAQTIVKFTDGYAEDLEVYSADASNNFVSVNFQGSFQGAVLEFISTDSPVNVANDMKLNIKGGSVNNQSLSMVTTDPFVIGTNSTLTLGSVVVYSHNTANTAACMIKLPDNFNNYATLNNTLFKQSGGYTGHIFCGPTGALTSGVPTINGTIKSYFDPALLFSGKLGGIIEMPGTAFSDKETSGIVFTNGIATQGLFYSAAGVALPTPAFPGPITSYVSDQTTACTGTYTSGAAVKCKVWWDGSAWKAF